MACKTPSIPTSTPRLLHEIMSKKVSSGKPKRGPPAHANSYAFHHNPSSKLTAHIMSLPINGLCPSCQAVIEWRKKYRKYKPLTVVKKCTACGEKRIKDAYHVICNQCSQKNGNQCAKCLLPPAQWKMESEVEIDSEGRAVGSSSLVSVKESASVDGSDESGSEEEEEEKYESGSDFSDSD